MKQLNTPFLTENLRVTPDSSKHLRSTCIQTVTKVFLLSLCLVIVSMVETQASHFRYGNISWRITSGTTVEYKVSMAFRSSYFGNPPIGTIMTPDVNFNHGDGTSRTIPLLVTSRSTSEDWFYGEATFTKTYANPSGVYIASFQSCCRIGSLKNNSNSNYRVETEVNLGTGNSSPVSTLPPIINLPQGVTAATFTIPASDPNGNSLAYSLTPSAQMGGGSNPAGLSIDATTGVATFSTVGTTIGWLYNASVTISDGNGARTAVDFLIKIATASNPPVFVSPTPANGTLFTIDLGQTVNFDVKATDPDAADIVTLQVAGLPGSATMTPTLPVSGVAGGPVESSFSWTPTSTGTSIVNFTAEDDNGAQTASSVTIVVNQQTCNLSLSTPTKTDVTCLGNSDGSITLNPTGGTAPFQYSIDDGATYQASNMFSGLAADTYIAKVKDANNCIDDATVIIGVQNNNLPVINSVTGPSEPVGLSDATVNMSADATDDNLSTATWDWGNGSTTAGTISGSTVTGSHTYTAAGVYRVILTVTDACGETATENFEYIVVYDPSAGFVTGGGWIESPTGAYTPGNVTDTDLVGKANFGFVSKYKKGAKIPDGQTQFQFHAAGLNFHSTQYEWLVVAGYKAQYKGEGTINGTGGYGFMLSAIDGNKKPSPEPDRFRIKIWEISSGNVIYDNQSEAADDAEASLAISGGSIVIHDGMKAKSTSALTVDKTSAQEETFGSFYSYPTAFAEKATIAFTLEHDDPFELELFDMKGALVKKISNGSAEAKKQYEFELNGTGLREGIYITRLATPRFVRSLKIVLKR